MEEILVERTIKALSAHLMPELAIVWREHEEHLLALDIGHQKSLDIPINPLPEDFFRFSLDERISSKNYRFIISCQRNVADSTHRAESASEYDIEIIFLYDYGFDGASRYYVPFRVRQAMIQAIEKNSRQFTGRSSDITLAEFLTAQASERGSRTIMAGLLYKIIA